MPRMTTAASYQTFSKTSLLAFRRNLQPYNMYNRPRGDNMSKSFTSLATVLAAMDVVAAPFHAQAPARTKTIAAQRAGMRKLDGFCPLCWGEQAGSLWLEIPTFGADLLLTTGLAEGLGSSDIGLGRGISDDGRIVRFERVG